MRTGVAPRAGWALALMLAALLGMFVSSASALQTHLLQGTFKPGAGFAQFGPHGIAIDQVSGRTYVSDVGGHAVYRFEAGGAAGTPAKLTAADGVTPASFSNPRGVAVDNSGGSGEGEVYVADRVAGTVRQFAPDGSETPRAPISATAVPLAGTPQGGGLPAVLNDGTLTPNGLAVDAAGNLYVADAGNDVVDVFAPDGSFVRQIGAGALSEPKWVAAAPSGEVYVTNDSGLVELSADGECVESCASIDYAGIGGVATDAAGHVYVSELGRVAEFDAERNPVGRFGEPTARPRFEGLSFVEGLAVDWTSGDVYLLDLTPLTFGNAAAIFGPRVTVPGASAEAAADPTPVGATFEGSVEPDGAAVTECAFEYGTARYDHSVPCAESPGSLGAGVAAVPVHAEVAGLEPETGYLFRLSAGNANGAARFEGSFFETPSAVAIAVEAPSDDAGRSIELHARLGDRGVPLDGCSFEYVTAAVFEAGGFAGAASAPCDPPPSSFPVDAAEHPVSAQASGLVGNTAYRFRVTASSAYGTTTVEGPGFTTAQTPPIVASGEAGEVAADSARLQGSVNPSGLQTSYYFEYGKTAAYGSKLPAGESPAGSGHLPVPVAATALDLQPATTYHYRLVAKNAVGEEAGEDVTFTTAPPAPAPPRAYELVSPPRGDPVVAGAGFQASPGGDAVTYLRAAGGGTPARFAAYRAADAWIERQVDAPEQSPVQPGPTEVTVAVSADLRAAVVVSRKQLTADAARGDWNVYRRDIASGGYAKLASADLGFHAEAAAVSQLFAGGTPGFDHVLLYGGGASFLEGAPPGALYDFHDGQLGLASLDPGESPLEADPSGSPHGGNLISADGQRVVFRAVPEGPLYLRSGGATRVISASQRAETLGAAFPATPIGGDAELRDVYFLSRELTDDSVAGGQLYLYRYDTSSSELTALTPVAAGGQEARPLQVSADGSSVYFSSPAALTPGADEAHENVYVWRDGAVEQVAALAPPGEGQPAPIGDYWASPNGRYFAFLAGSPAQVYRYDADRASLLCASCPAGSPAGPPGGPAGAPGPSPADGLHAPPRLVDDRGEVFFDSPDRLAPGDLDDARDVYEYSDEAGLRLLSSGRGDADSLLAEVGADGRDVFFTTADRLVGVDGNGALDLYDARRGGGIPSQNAVPPAPCGDCGPAGTPAGAAVAPAAARHRRKASHHRRRHRHGHRRRCRASRRAQGAKAHRCHRKGRHPAKKHGGKRRDGGSPRGPRGR